MSSVKHFVASRETGPAGAPSFHAQCRNQQVILDVGYERTMKKLLEFREHDSPACRSGSRQMQKTRRRGEIARAARISPSGWAAGSNPRNSGILFPYPGHYASKERA